MASNYSFSHDCTHSDEEEKKDSVQCGDMNSSMGKRDKWSCPQCTLLNEDYKHKCSACWSHKGAAYNRRRTPRYAKKLENEVRIVLLGKTGSGKSATGNTILNGNFFETKSSGSSVTSRCSSNNAQRFGREIQIVDTPGIFDTNTPNNVVQKEIVKCIGITSPGPHCFLLVLGLSRFTQEEEESINHFVNYFGEEVFRYFVILFTRKDDLDFHGLTLDDHIRSVPQNLKTIIEKCGHRCIAFNNRAPSPARHDQVEDLLKMIDEIVRQNHGEHYTNDMYSEAEKVMKHREHQIEKDRGKKREEERKAIEIEIKKKYGKQIRSQEKKKSDLEIRVAELESMQNHHSKRPSAPGNKEKEKELKDLRSELNRMQKESKEMMEEKDREYQEQIEILEKKYEERENPRQVARVEVENGNGNIFEHLLGGIFNIGKLVWKGITDLFS